MTLSSKRFRGTQYHNPIRVKTIIKESKHLLLKLGLHVNKQVAAREDIELGKWRMHRNIVLSKHNLFPDFCIDEIAIISFQEKRFNRSGETFAEILSGNMPFLLSQLLHYQDLLQIFVRESSCGLIFSRTSLNTIANE